MGTDTETQTSATRSTVLVTGGTGYLGQRVIATLLDRGHAVRTTVRSRRRSDSIVQAVAEVHPNPDLTIVVADLLADGGWDEAVTGVDAVVHTASPLPTDRSQDVVRAAREGIRRVLQASARAGVARVVLTSSGHAAAAGRTHGTVDETMWGEASGKRADAYARSKILSERDAWSLVASDSRMPTLTTILPGLIQGPLLGPRDGRSAAMITGRLLSGRMPALPNIGWGVVDVRDLADLHVRALTAPAAAGERFLAVGDFLWWRDIAALLRRELGPQARRVTTRRLPDLAVKLGALMNPDLAAIAPTLGRHVHMDSTKARRLLGWKPRPARETIIDTARDLIAHGILGG